MTGINKIGIPHFTSSELNPKVLKLFEILQRQAEAIQQLRDEIAELKGLKKKPKIKPSRMEEETEEEGKKQSGKGKRPGSSKKNKTKDLEIHSIKVIQPKSIPKGSVFKGYKDYVLQDLEIRSRNTLYRLGRWLTPRGEYVEGVLPQEVEGHFGAMLKSYIHCTNTISVGSPSHLY